MRFCAVRAAAIEAVGCARPQPLMTAGSSAAGPASAPPPGLRWTIVGLLSASIAINLIDRQVLSVLAPVLRDAMQLSATDTPTSPPRFSWA
jgi:hypothetical protein